ncbi:CHASE domain-containing hybrid sensor histidine kinase/response regulator [Azohydromonas australica]|uniref:CHASE domain-containing hybrid sensor histidine kinase/response regulator n=1 Tax=Azohydromonas australica TaxID=364039 RepID=UPI000686B3C5|nr:CHASE domain-containing protein [Azohydromonas australica]
MSKAGLLWPLGLLLTGLVAAAWAGRWQAQRNEALQHERFQALAQQTAAQLLKRISIYEYAVRGVRGAVMAAGVDALTREGLRQYAESRDMQREFPGMRNFGFVRRVPARQEAAFLQAVRLDGAPEFQIRQFAAHGGDRFVVQYIEPPLDGVASAQGVDLASEPRRREAALAAMLSGESRITAPLTLVQLPSEHDRSFLLLLAVYRTGKTPEPAQRDAQTVGWATVPLVMQQMLEAFDKENTAFAMKLSDASGSGTPERFYASTEWQESAAGALAQRVTLPVYGRTWLLQMQPLPPFTESLRLRQPGEVALTVGTLSLLLALLLYGSQQLARSRRVVRQERASRAAVVDSAHDAIVIHTLHGEITGWNAAAERLLGWSAREVMGRRLSELTVPLEQRHTVQRMLEEVQRNQAVPPVETVCLDRQGARLEVAVSMAPLHAGNGLVAGAATTLRDIRAQRAGQARILELNATLERQVLERRLELSMVLERAATAIIATDLSGRITVFNPAAEAMLRIPAREAIGRLETDFRDHEEMRARLHAYPREVLENAGELPEWLALAAHQALASMPGDTMGSQRSEWTYVRADGSRVPGLASVSLLRGAQGRPTGFLAVITDLTERKALEERLRERTRQAESANAAKSAFLAHMSHEIRTPLNAIIGMGYLLRQTQLTERQQLFATHINTAGEQLLCLVNDVLDLSKIEAGEMRLEAVPFGLPDLLEQSRSMVEVAAAQKNLPLLVESAPGMPRRLVGDPTRLKQILVNLLGNAVKFTEAGRVTLRVAQLARLEGAAEQPWPLVTVRFEVIDTGIGIPLEKQAAIFEPFTQADDSTTRRFGGTGLGLSIVRRLVGLMGGQLELQSQPGQGSTFSVTLTMQLPQP